MDKKTLSFQSLKNIVLKTLAMFILYSVVFLGVARLSERVFSYEMIVFLVGTFLLILIFFINKEFKDQED